MSTAPYFLYSKLPGNPNLGIWYLSAQQEQASEQAAPFGQPVRLAADLVEWIARPRIIGGGPTRLGVGPYKYTGEYKGEAFASNNSEYSRDWFLIPANYEQYYLIAADPRGNLVWTAGEDHGVIRIEPVTGGDNQLFTFKPAIRE